MSKIIEYLKLIPKGLSNPKELIGGWLTDIKLEYGELPEDEIEEILKRRSTCFQCPFVSTLATKSKEYEEVFGEHYKTDRTDIHCTCCSCPINKKTSSLSSECGIKSNIKTEHLNLKWSKYEAAK